MESIKGLEVYMPPSKMVCRSSFLRGDHEEFRGEESNVSKGPFARDSMEIYKCSPKDLPLESMEPMLNIDKTVRSLPPDEGPSWRSPSRASQESAGSWPR
jgi:hypothetical protein